MRSLVVSTFVYFIAAFFIRRYFESQGLPKGMTRGLMVFCLALAVAYGAAAGMDWLGAHG